MTISKKGMRKINVHGRYYYYKITGHYKELRLFIELEENRYYEKIFKYNITITPKVVKEIIVRELKMSK